MMRKQGIFSIVFLIPLLLLIAGGIIFWGIKQSRSAKQSAAILQASPVTAASPSPKDNSLKTFKSKTLKFSIEVPTKFQIDEKFTTVDLKSDEGSILISRNGTNFDNLNDYIAEFDSRRNLSVLSVEKLNINGNDSLVRIISFTDEGIKQKSYYIFIDQSVFILSTQNDILYSDLDQIAKSFRYTP